MGASIASSLVTRFKSLCGGGVTARGRVRRLTRSGYTLDCVISGYYHDVSHQTDIVLTVVLLYGITTPFSILIGQFLLYLLLFIFISHSGKKCRSYLKTPRSITAITIYGVSVPS